MRLEAVRTGRRFGWLFSVILGMAALLSDTGRADVRPSTTAMTVKVIDLAHKGRFKSAIALAQTVVARTKETDGLRHFRYADALNNLAILYDLDGRPIESEKIYLEALQILETQPWPVSAKTIGVKNNLAAVLLQQCRLREARRLFEEALADNVRAFGDYHPDSLRVRENLVGLNSLLGAPMTGVAASEPQRAASIRAHPVAVRIGRIDVRGCLS